MHSLMGMKPTARWPGRICTVDGMSTFGYSSPGPRNSPCQGFARIGPGVATHHCRGKLFYDDAMKAVKPLPLAACISERTSHSVWTQLHIRPPPLRLHLIPDRRETSLEGRSVKQNCENARSLTIISRLFNGGSATLLAISMGLEVARLVTSGAISRADVESDPFPGENGHQIGPQSFVSHVSGPGVGVA